MEVFGNSLGFDRKLFEADIRVNQEWALALVDVGVYTKDEAELVRTTLDQVRYEFNQGQLSFADSDEDIHTANERWLTEKLSDLGARIHTGRSRNDQVVTDLKIYIKENLIAMESALAELQESLVALAEDHVETVLPGQTHLRQAQPVSFAHYLLALFFQLQRDRERIRSTFKLLDKCPLGSGAIAGAAFPIDRLKLARRLGFSGPTENSYDSTCDRDYIVDCHTACVQIAIHLSRYAEDLIIWSTEPFGFVEIDEQFATGSSMMPQKKNPDSLELIRGKSARIIGNATSGAALLKGIPTAYVRDLQEDKEPLFDSLENVLNMIRVFTGVVDTLEVRPQRMVESLDSALYATDVADYLVKKGVPFRKAHSLAGRLVSHAEEKGKSLSQLTFEEFRQVSDLFEADVHQLFDPISALDKRNLYGGTGRESVKNQIGIAKSLLEEGSG